MYCSKVGFSFKGVFPLHYFLLASRREWRVGHACASLPLLTSMGVLSTAKYVCLAALGAPTEVKGESRACAATSPLPATGTDQAGQKYCHGNTPLSPSLVTITASYCHKKNGP